ncbi:hypothetical protein N5079_03925 [Planotetraspora sp. A-T 1434]|nr:hypothetical protein [Planotetraspora sp. A-T 1434]MCT9929364.1 hypothetical protein [Planotetraspora sp. A-T 1434]
MNEAWEGALSSASVSAVLVGAERRAVRLADVLEGVVGAWGWAL